jgi:pimeloyl-ACP methyl ester carboxylesterase
MKQVYLMPGMAASPLIFEHIKLPADAYELHYIDWLTPLEKEPLVTYCKRLLPQILHENPVLIGVSFGGIIVQELAKLISVEKLIIISSVKSISEFPRRMRFSKKTGLHRVLPTSFIENFDSLAKYGMRIAPKKIEMYKKYLHRNDRQYLDWALETIIHWDQEKPPVGIIHIHGEKDPIFPIKYIIDCIIVPEGTHVMIINRYRWFNENLPKIIGVK